MASNQYINKVQFGNETIMDISDTTAESGDVLSNKVFYTKSGARSTGSLGAMTGATSQDNGAMGLVPAPTTSDISKFLCGDGTWAIPTNTTYSTFVQSGSNAAAGLVPAPSTTAGTTAFLCEDGSWKVPYSVFTGATTSVAGAAGLVPAPTVNDTQKVLCGNGTWSNRMVILSYGSTTWDEALAAYLSNAVVYCRASSNNNPATGSQTRMAFLAYVNDAVNPTEFEFQYYRSVSTHKNTQMGDEVYVYKFNKTNGWSVTKRLASLQQITGTGITVGYTANTNVLTLTNDVTVSDSLTDTSTTKALSAAKGKALQDTIGSTTMGTTATTITGAIAEHESDISSLSDHLAQKQDKGSSGRLSQNVSVSSNWTYTGLSVTIPYGKIFGVSGYQQYNDTAPTGMAISSSNNNMQSYNSLIIEGCNQCAFTGFVHESSGRTYYLWAKAGNTGNNNVALEYWYM